MPADKPRDWGIDTGGPADGEAEGDEGPDEEESGAEQEGQEPSEEEAGEGEAGEDASAGDETEGEEEPDDGAEEVHEVEAEEAPPRPRKRHPKGRPRAGRPEPERPKSRAALWAVVVLILILVPVMGLIYFYYGPSGDIKEINIIAQSYSNSQGSGVYLSTHLDTGKPSNLAGEADVTITFRGNQTYAGKMAISSSQGTKSIPYGQFCVGNGNYTVQVGYQGKSSEAPFDVTGMIEKLNVLAYNITRATNSSVENGTAFMGVRVIFANLNNQSQLATSADSLEIEVNGGGGLSKYTESVVSKTMVEATYQLQGNGNYTLKATFHNSKMKAGSQYSSLVVQGSDSRTGMPYVLVFIPPRAEAGPDQTVQYKVIDGGGKASFDGSKSNGYGGATIVGWQWDFGDGTYEGGMTIEHTFTRVNDAENPFYVVLLTVTDSNGILSTDSTKVVVQAQG